MPFFAHVYRISGDRAGEIVSAAQAQDEETALMQPIPSGCAALVTNAPAPARDFYVARGALMPRPPQPDIAKVAGGIVFADDIPPDTIVKVSDGVFSHEVVPTERTLHQRMPGTWRVKVSWPWPYREAEYEIDGDPEAVPPANATDLAPPIDTVRAHYIAAINAKFALEVQKLSPSDEERSTWDAQRRWAETALADLSAPEAGYLAALISPSERAEADALGSAYATYMAQKIVAKSLAISTIVARLVGFKRAAEKAIENTQDPASVVAYANEDLAADWLSGT